jgi:hypothetical protein
VKEHCFKGAIESKGAIEISVLAPCHFGEGAWRGAKQVSFNSQPHATSALIYLGSVRSLTWFAPGVVPCHACFATSSLIKPPPQQLNVH